jgi:hypothetical protein
MAIAVLLFMIGNVIAVLLFMKGDRGLVVFENAISVLFFMGEKCDRGFVVYG